MRMSNENEELELGLRRDFPRVWPSVHSGLWRVGPGAGLKEPWFEAKIGRQIQSLELISAGG